MNVSFHYGSITRRAHLMDGAFAVEARPRAAWEGGDFVVGEVAGLVGSYPVEWPDGHSSEVVIGEHVVGAFGNRCATMELVGDWRAIGDDFRMDALTDAGVFGRCTSRAATAPTPMALRYLGHVIVNGQKARMADYVGQPRSTRCDVPVIQLIGTSMECGKTTAGRATIRLLKQRGLRVAGAKLTGVARYHDIQSMRDAGADFVLDFVDVGLPSSLLPPPEFAGCVDHMLGLIADQSVDVAVVEMGASPMEPYNGEVAMERLRDQVQFTILAATDLYAALGAIDHLSVKPDLIVGRVASTSAGITIVEHETGIPTINPLDPESTAGLEALLARTPVWRRLAGRGG